MVNDPNELKPFEYTPPDAEVVISPTIGEYEVKKDPVEQEFEELREIVDKYTLISEMCKYLEKMVDKEMSEVSVKYDPEYFPDVYRAMTRLFPADDPTEVTYSHYKKALDFINDLVINGVF